MIIIHYTSIFLSILVFQFSFKLSTISQSRKATREEVELIHTKDHIDLMYSMEALSEEDLQSLQEKYRSIYLNPKSNDAALLAVGSLLQVSLRMNFYIGSIACMRVIGGMS